MRNRIGDGKKFFLHIRNFCTGSKTLPFKSYVALIKSFNFWDPVLLTDGKACFPVSEWASHGVNVFT